MNKLVYYIKRKPSRDYKSIEGLFDSIKRYVSQFYNTEDYYVKYRGGSPFTLVKNIFGFSSNVDNSVIHITGDVHYMALSPGKNKILTIHDIGSALKGNRFKRIYKILFWFWLPSIFVKRITVISEFTKKELQSIIPFAKSKIVVIPNPVSPKISFSQKSFNEDCPLVLFVGTKDNKNLIRTISALEEVKSKLIIIGSLRSEQLKQLSLSSIDYESFADLSFDEVIECYRNCDLLCFPSTYEGFGMPIIEAQAAGKPVVTSNIGAMLEVAGKGACLVDPFSIESIRNGIVKVIQNESYREELITRGFKNVENYQIKNIAQKYMDLYAEL